MNANWASTSTLETPAKAVLQNVRNAVTMACVTPVFQVSTSAELTACTAHHCTQPASPATALTVCPASTATSWTAVVARHAIQPSPNANTVLTTARCAKSVSTATDSRLAVLPASPARASPAASPARTPSPAPSANRGSGQWAMALARSARQTVWPANLALSVWGVPWAFTSAVLAFARCVLQ